MAGFYGRWAWGPALSPQGPSVHSVTREPGQLAEDQVLTHIQGDLPATGCAGRQDPSVRPRPTGGQGGQPAAPMLGLVVQWWERRRFARQHLLSLTCSFLQ